MGLVDDFILTIKKKEGFRFDGQVAEFIGIDRRVLANYKHNKSLPYKLQEWYCDRYDVKIKDFHKEIELTNTDIQIKGDDSMDARYVIDLQRDKIENQQQEINRLTAIVQKQSKNVKNKPAFHFKTKRTYDCETKSFGRNIVTGDTSMTGFTEKELSRLTGEEWSAMYHPDSLETLMSSIPDEVPDHTHNIWKHILWKAKDGSYKVYNIESYHDKTEGIVRAYYYWVNGDVEGQS